MALHYQIVPVTPFVQNCSVLWCERTREAAVVDPGGEVGRIEQVLVERGLSLKVILLTHGHVDHVGGAAALARASGAPIHGPHSDDAFLIEGLERQSAMFGFPPVEPFAPDRWLQAGEVVGFGEQALEVLHTPGHTPGHLVFFARATRLALVGDVLFKGSIGRTDLPRGDYETLICSIKERLWPLGDDVTFVPGHGPRSTFGGERRANPYVAD